MYAACTNHGSVGGVDVVEHRAGQERGLGVLGARRPPAHPARPRPARTSRGRRRERRSPACAATSPHALEVLREIDDGAVAGQHTLVGEEARVVGRERARIGRRVGVPEEHRVVARGARFEREVREPRVERCAVERGAVLHEVLAGVQRRARRAARRRLRVVPPEQHALGREPVEVRRPHDRMAGRAEAVAPPLVDGDQAGRCVACHRGKLRARCRAAGTAPRRYGNAATRVRARPRPVRDRRRSPAAAASPPVPNGWSPPERSRSQPPLPSGESAMPADDVLARPVRTAGVGRGGAAEAVDPTPGVDHVATVAVGQQGDPAGDVACRSSRASRSGAGGHGAGADRERVQPAVAVELVPAGAVGQHRDPADDVPAGPVRRAVRDRARCPRRRRR